MRIVMGVDGSDASLTALDLVAGTSWPTETKIRLVGAFELPAVRTGLAAPPSDPMADDDLQRTLFDSLRRLSEPLQRGGLGTETVVARGRAADVLLAEAEDLSADLIVVGNRGLGTAASVLLGSVSATLVDHADCPVLVARRPRISRILVATDGSQSSEAIPAVVASWDVFRDLPIDVLCVAPATRRGKGAAFMPMVAGIESQLVDASHEVDRYLVMADEMAARLVAAGWRATSSVRRGEAAREIETAALDLGADLIITGSRGLSGLQRLLLGSVAHHVLLHSQCSVLVMRGHVPARQHRPLRLAAAATG
ncbi:MAG: universal stress protein [Chloroflexi bacterium]|nr:universal stress protein [Chloroflexota bacterium]